MDMVCIRCHEAIEEDQGFQGTRENLMTGERTNQVLIYHNHCYWPLFEERAERRRQARLAYEEEQASEKAGDRYYILVDDRFYGTSLYGPNRDYSLTEATDRLSTLRQRVDGRFTYTLLKIIKE